MVLGTWLVENHALTIGQPPERSIIKVDDLSPSAGLIDPEDLREMGRRSSFVPVVSRNPRRLCVPRSFGLLLPDTLRWHAYGARSAWSHPVRYANDTAPTTELTSSLASMPRICVRTVLSET